VASPSRALAAGSGPNDVVRQRVDALVRDDGFPAALASVRGRDGRFRNYTAGVGDLKTRSRVPVDGQVRIGSNAQVDHMSAAVDTALCQ
jgi:D-alanyl-D-alanine carboxypeptidase